MAVNTTKITSGPYTGNGVADTFSYEFRVQNENQLSVFETDADGNQTTLTVNTDYTVNDIGEDTGGTIVRLAGPLPTGYTWYIRSNYQPTQETSFRSQGAFFPKLHENAMDKLTFLIQQMQDFFDRSLKVSDSYTGDLPLSIDDPEPDLFLKWKTDLSGIENVAITDSALVANGQMLIFSDVASMEQSTNNAIVPGMNIVTQGFDVQGDGGGAWYIVASGGVFRGFKDRVLSNGLYAKWQSGIGALTGRPEDTEFKAEDKYFGGQSAITEGGGVLILGDSITQGYGAGDFAGESYRDGYAFKAIQSIYNSVDQGPGQDRGYRYGTNMSLASELADPNVSTTGTLQTIGGAVDSFISLAAGQSITIAGREITFSDVYYTAGVGSLEFYLNDVLFATKTLTTGSGNSAVFTTFPTQIKPDATYIKDTDTIRIQAAAGSSVNITGLLTLRTSNSNYSPHVIVAAKSGWAFDNFNQATRAENISLHMNLLRGAGRKILVVVNLGTNDIYNPSHANNPTGYIAELSELIDQYTNYLDGDAEFMIQVPLEAVAPTGTVTGHPYLEFVNAIIDFCQENGHQLYRVDKTSVSANAVYNFDTIHPNKTGATILAREFCRTLGIPYNPHVPATVLVNDDPEPTIVVAEANSQAEEDAAFNQGALAVVRLDLISPDSSLFLDFENASDVTEDTSRIVHQGVITGSVLSVGTSAPVGLKSANFSSGYITYPDHPSFDISGNQWGFECYIKLTSNTKSNFLMSKGANGDLNNAWYFALLSSGGTNLNVTFTSENNNAYIFQPYPHELDLTNYHHISFNCDGSNITVYIDGELFFTVAATSVPNHTGNVFVGGWNNDAPGVGSASGLLDQVVISNTGPLRTGEFTPPTGP